MPTCWATPPRQSRRILIASGSELSLAVLVHERLLAEGVRSRLVSMPSWDLFEHQSREYRESVLPPRVKARVAVEQGSTLGWERYVGESGRVIGMTTFGASAPLKELQRKFGFEPEGVMAAAMEQLGGERSQSHPQGAAVRPDQPEDNHSEDAVSRQRPGAPGLDDDGAWFFVYGAAPKNKVATGNLSVLLSTRHAQKGAGRETGAGPRGSQTALSQPQKGMAMTISTQVRSDSSTGRSSRRTENKAWVAKAAKQPMVLETVDLGPLGAEDVEIAVENCGLCHSDLSVLNNDWGFRSTPRFSATRSSVGSRPWVRMPRDSASASASASAGTRLAACTVASACREAITFARKCKRPSSVIAAGSRPTSARTGLGPSRCRRS